MDWLRSQRPDVFSRSRSKKTSRLPAFLFLGMLAIACGAPASAPSVGGMALRDEGGHEVRVGIGKTPVTVLLFFSADCPVQKAHDARVREIVQRYGPRGAAFFAVVSESGADVQAERAAARERGLDMPVLQDRDAAVADALGVEFSTHAVVLGPDGKVLYSGGIDSDRTHLTEGAERWLERAIEAGLEGRSPTKARTEPLGCPLRKH